MLLATVPISPLIISSNILPLPLTHSLTLQQLLIVQSILIYSPLLNLLGKSICIEAVMKNWVCLECLYRLQIRLQWLYWILIPTKTFLPSNVSSSSSSYLCLLINENNQVDDLIVCSNFIRSIERTCIPIWMRCSSCQIDEESIQNNSSITSWL